MAARCGEGESGAPAGAGAAAWGWAALERLLLRGIDPEPIRLTERQAADLVALLRRCALAGLALGLAIGTGAGLLVGRLL